MDERTFPSVFTAPVTQLEALAVSRCDVNVNTPSSTETRLERQVADRHSAPLMPAGNGAKQLLFVSEPSLHT